MHNVNQTGLNQVTLVHSANQKCLNQVTLVHGHSSGWPSAYRSGLRTKLFSVVQRSGQRNRKWTGIPVGIMVDWLLTPDGVSLSHAEDNTTLPHVKLYQQQEQGNCLLGH